MNRRQASLLAMTLCCLSCFGSDALQAGCEKGFARASEKVKGFTITIEPAHEGAQSCRAAVAKKKEIVFETLAQSIRLKMFGGDMNGDGKPEVALETDTGNEAGCCSLHLVSLGKTPGLLRTIAKGRYFSVEDRDGDRVYEIWAGDADGFDGFDGLPKGSLEIIPTVVFRMRDSQLGDAGAEFYDHYDSLIARLRVALAAERMKGFLASDGKLEIGSTAELARLRETKGLVLALWVVICASGRIGQVRIQRSLGDGLDQKAIEAVRQWKFEPARKNGAPVAVQVNIEVNFRMY